MTLLLSRGPPAAPPVACTAGVEDGLWDLLTPKKALYTTALLQVFSFLCQ